MIYPKKNFLLKKFTTMAMGGPAKFFIAIKNEKELLEAIKFAKTKKIQWYVVGQGSNLIVNDKGFRGVVIQNQIQKFDLYPHFISPYPASRDRGRKRGASQERRVVVGAGNNLLEAIFTLNRLGFRGLERMAGIPGTVGGAIYGCAGAYGQEIKDHLKSVKIWDGKGFRTLIKNQCQFGYRDSIFKTRKDWIILEAAFKLGVGDRRGLSQISKEIIKLREKKYKLGLKCPGSFFKNIKLSEMPVRERQRFLKKIKKDKIVYGKVPTGYLLEAVGAKGLKERGIRVATHHANLIYNAGRGKAADIKKLATKLKRLAKRKFSINIEEEVQYLGFKK